MSIERVVVVLTPIFAALAAWITGLIGTHFPGVHIDSSQIIALEIAGFTGAAAIVWKWLEGRQKFVAFTDDAKKTLDDALEKIRAELAATPQAALAIGDIENLLKSHEAQIEQTIDAHVPVAVAQALQALFAQIGGAPVTPAPAVAAAPAVPAQPA